MYIEYGGHVALENTLPQEPCDLKASEFGAKLPHRVVAASACGPTTDGIEVGVSMPGSLVHGVRLPRQHDIGHIAHFSTAP
jgi:hypothetical protein